MKKTKIILITSAVFCGVALLIIALLVSQWLPFLTGKTNRDFFLILKNGYHLSRTNADTCYISPPGGTWTSDLPPVPAHIVQAKIVNTVVIGKTVKRKNSSIESFEGYFILDLSTGKSQYGLKQGKWMELLEKEYGISDFSLLLPHEAYENWKNKK